MYTFNPNELISSTKINDNFTEAFGGAWTSYTPTLTNFTLGDGTVVASYIQQGKTVHGVIKFTLGSTSAVGSSGVFTLPVTASSVVYKLNVTGGTNIGLVTAQDTGTSVYSGIVSLVSSTTAGVYFGNATATYLTLSNITSAIPHTWASTDVLTLTFTYEAN